MERVFAGTAASPGLGLGAADVLAVALDGSSAMDADAALDAAAVELERLAADLLARGLADEAEVVETGALMAGDPGLRADVAARVADGATAIAALLGATDTAAATIAALPDEMLAARADDVRSLGRRAARIASGRPDRAAEGVLVAEDLGPADVAELGAVTGIALARGGVTAHAAIVARSLGIPMVVGLGEDVLATPPGTPLVVDGDSGELVSDPGPSRVGAAVAATEARDHARRRAARERDLPARTLDGRTVRVLANVAAAAEVDVALQAGAEGAGLIRTELAFLEAPAWPSEADHRRALAPVLDALDGRTATVRVLDFGGDKTPPFLAGTDKRGIELMLAAPDALAAQLRAAVALERGDLRILLPMVAGAADVTAVRALAPDVALGAMVETPEAAYAAAELAAAADFLSIGTNDLTHATLGSDRWKAGDAPAHHPAVLNHIALCAAAAHAAGKVLEVCGEASSNPLTMPLLVGLGVDELSVGAARVGSVRAWVRALRLDETRELAAQALEATDADAVEQLMAPVARRLALLERGDGAGEDVDGVGRVAALRT
jgi:multiphosphoryl transfer protein